MTKAERHPSRGLKTSHDTWKAQVGLFACSRTQEDHRQETRMSLFNVAQTTHPSIAETSEFGSATPSNGAFNSVTHGDHFEASAPASIFNTAPSLVADASVQRTLQQQHGDLEWQTFTFNGEPHQVLSLSSVGRYSQTYEGAADEDYNWGTNPFGTGHTMDQVGCTITALGNALGATGEASPSPTQTNHRTAAFWDAFNAAEFEDLSGQGRQIRKRYGLPPKIEQMNPVDIYNADQSGYTAETRNILSEAAQAVREGKSVLIGFRGNGRGYRHSVVIDAVGDQLWASDPYTSNSRSRRLPLADLMKEQGHRQIDYAYAVSRSDQENPENSLNPEFWGP